MMETMGTDMRIAASLLAIALLCATAAHAGWQEEASPFDVQRLADLDASRAKGLSEAQSGADMAVIHAVLDPARQPIAANALTGSWRCRTIKLGGMSASVVYSWFRCRVSDRGGRLFFEKVSGSQRTSGYLYPQDGGFVYLGALHMSTEREHAYSGNGASAGAPGTPDDQIGYLAGIGGGRARIEFPEPVQESTFDVLELAR
jgi:hypothetical protein